MNPKTKKQQKYAKLKIFILLALIATYIVGFITWEMQTSRLQSMFFWDIAKRCRFQVQSGKSDNIRFPVHGPYDIRMGYVRIPEWTDRLKERGIEVNHQARWSETMIKYAEYGLFPPYSEKSRAGIQILDTSEREILKADFPNHTYPSFDSIPPFIVDMLLYVENRKLLDQKSPYINPAIEWERLTKAVMDAGIRLFDPNHLVPGGSTLATQMEKFRHSPEGITDSAQEKLRQILSASLRSYLGGEKTINTRKKIVVDYINSIPLSAIPGYGEVNGLGDGLWAWYGMNFQIVNQLLFNASSNQLTSEQLIQTGSALTAVLSLFLSQRRPTDYLMKHQNALQDLTQSYLRLLLRDGIIPQQLYNAAINARLNLKKEAFKVYALDRSHQKAANLIRTRLLSDLKVDTVYNLDRIDLTVKSTIDMECQKKTTQTLESLNDPEFANNKGLTGQYLLESSDPAKVIYSVSLFEKTPEGSALRVQTNNFEGPFNIDEQMKLDLGSSAKLRTLAHYLEIISTLHDRYAGLSNSVLSELSQEPTFDHISRWAIDYLLASKDRNLTTMLDAGMEREYSASPGEQFMTGGGLHAFANFNKEDNAKIMSVRMAFRNSVNLVFIRLMRDIVYYHIFQRYGVTPRSLEYIDTTERKRLLTIFADREGKTFIKKFYGKYHAKDIPTDPNLLYMEIHPTPPKLSAVFRYIDPEASLEEFGGFIRGRLPGSKLMDSDIIDLFDRYGPGKYSLADIGYIAHIHPLELWVVRYLLQHPDATLSQIINDSHEERQNVYNWLFKTKSRYKQNKRIRTIIELEAFEDIHQAWEKLGYPFDYLVPSYATSIGSSGDRPGALAELAGIIQNNGVRLPVIRYESLSIGEKTPYETRFTIEPALGEQVMTPEVALFLKQAMMDVVEEGTARRLKPALDMPDGTRLTAGGKTGTGDHRYKTFGTGGVLIGSKVMNRAATFIFFIGERHFGSVTAYVPGREAENYSFSSALPVQVLKMLFPDFVPLVYAKDLKTKKIENDKKPA
jgi:membrane peptidoglycan carboxypeptidase